MHSIQLIIIKVLYYTSDQSLVTGFNLLKATMQWIKVLRRDEEGFKNRSLASQPPGDGF